MGTRHKSRRRVTAVKRRILDVKAEQLRQQTGRRLARGQEAHKPAQELEKALREGHGQLQQQFEAALSGALAAGLVLVKEPEEQQQEGKEQQQQQEGKEQQDGEAAVVAATAASCSPWSSAAAVRGLKQGLASSSTAVAAGEGVQKPGPRPNEPQQQQGAQDTQQQQQHVQEQGKQQVREGQGQQQEEKGEQNQQQQEGPIFLAAPGSGLMGVAAAAEVSALNLALSRAGRRLLEAELVLKQREKKLAEAEKAWRAAWKLPEPGESEQQQTDGQQEQQQGGVEELEREETLGEAQEQHQLQQGEGVMSKQHDQSGQQQQLGQQQWRQGEQEAGQGQGQGPAAVVGRGWGAAQGAGVPLCVVEVEEGSSSDDWTEGDSSSDGGGDGVSGEMW